MTAPVVLPRGRRGSLEVRRSRSTSGHGRSVFSSSGSSVFSYEGDSGDCFDRENIKFTIKENSLVTSKTSETFKFLKFETNVKQDIVNCANSAIFLVWSGLR